MGEPQCVVLAGPNGSGKTSIYEKMRPPGVFVNADQIARTLATDLSEPALSIEAGRIAVLRTSHLIATKSDFAIETTLSGRYGLNVMQRAKSAGFKVGLIYVIVDAAQRSIERVRFRALMGGHDVPAEDIRRRYGRSLDNLAAALQAADEFVIIDNSTKVPQILIEASDRLRILEIDGEFAVHRRLIETVQTAVGNRFSAQNVIDLRGGRKERPAEPKP